MTFKQVEKILLKMGWYRYKVVGSHYQYKHNEKQGKITIPRHCKELKKGTLNSILHSRKLHFLNVKNIAQKNCNAIFRGDKSYAS